MPGKMETAYKRITRFLRSCDPKEALWKLFDQKAKCGLTNGLVVVQIHLMQVAAHAANPGMSVLDIIHGVFVTV